MLCLPPTDLFWFIQGCPPLSRRFPAREDRAICTVPALSPAVLVSTEPRVWLSPRYQPTLCIFPDLGGPCLPELPQLDPKQPPAGAQH